MQTGTHASQAAALFSNWHKAEANFKNNHVPLMCTSFVLMTAHRTRCSLYVEQIDLGEEGGPRTIVSGLVRHVTLEDLVGRRVVVLANLKPRSMRGVKSAGMLLCAANEDHTVVEPLRVPDAAVTGERVWAGSEVLLSTEPATPNQVRIGCLCLCAQSECVLLPTMGMCCVIGSRLRATQDCALGPTHSSSHSCRSRRRKFGRQSSHC